jgi:hypothetical protein
MPRLPNALHPIEIMNRGQDVRRIRSPRRMRLHRFAAIICPIGHIHSDPRELFVCLLFARQTYRQKSRTLRISHQGRRRREYKDGVDGPTTDSFFRWGY